jgi:pantoate--beta-alanine ligase
MSAPVVRTVAEVRDAVADARRREDTVGLVPTMGSLHDGHLSLIRAARERCDFVVMSLFVNPAQFGEGEDLDAYPRDEARDTELAGAAGADLVWAPDTAEVYPDGFATRVEVEGLTDVLCGDPSRRGAAHFRGVTTVVAKLLNVVEPDAAFFGQKDAQQAVVIRRMARDLNYRAQIVVLPTVREADGLAMSSRNAYLDPDERRRAASLNRALAAAAKAAEAGATPDSALEAARDVLTESGVEPEYLEARYADDLATANSFNGRAVLIALAARLGRARLIDNVVIGPEGGRAAPDPADTRK